MKKYSESQNFITKWLLVLFIVLIGIELNTIYKEYVIDNVVHFGVSFWIFLAVMLCLFFMRLHLSIDAQGITLKFLPFVINKKWNWQDIESAYITEYGLSDYGGWGYRIGKKGTAYTTKGKYGIQLLLKNGKKILIGTQQPEEVALILASYFDKKEEI